MRIAVGLAGVQVPCGQTGGVVVIETEEPRGVEFLQLHQRLVEVGGVALALARHGLPPHLGHRGNVVVILAQIVVQPVRLVAVPLVTVSVVMALAEHADALVEHQLRVRLVGLPLCRLLPDGLAVAALQVEAGVDGRRRVVVVARGVGVAHIVERMPHLMGHRVADGLAGRRTEPEGAHLVVVAAAVAHPVRRVVQQHHYLIAPEVGLRGVHKAQLVDFQVVEGLALLEQVLLVDAVGRRRLRGQHGAVALVPEHDDVVGLHAPRLRPRVLAVGVALGIEQRVRRPRVAPLVGYVHRLLRHRADGKQPEANSQNPFHLVISYHSFFACKVTQ